MACVVALAGLTFFSATRTLPLVDDSDSTTALETEVDALGSELAAVQTSLDEQVGTFNQAISDLSAENEAQATSLTDALATNAQLETTLDETGQRLAAVEAEKLALETEIDGLTGQIGDLNAHARDRRASDTDVEVTIQTLNEELIAQAAEAEAAQSTIALLESEKSEIAQQIAEVEAAAEAAQAAVDSQVADLEARLAESDAAFTAVNAQVAQLRETQNASEVDAPDTAVAIAEFESQVQALTAQNTALNEALVKRDDVITGLMATADVPDMDFVTTCQERSDSLVSDVQIGFEVGNTLTNDSASLLERFAMVAIECIQDDLMLEIEGHTDNSGGFASNLLLSDARAKAVLEFLAEQGVPASAMRSLGFGDREPIADNSTDIGRSQNQRIIFDWEEG
jgi:outer membrane protein OmpA-like peptidoglycan-associated protein